MTYWFDGYEDLDDEDQLLIGEDSIKLGPNLTKLCEQSWSHTPDFIELKNCKMKEFPIFFADALQVGKRLNFMVRGARYYGRAVTTYEGFSLKRKADSDDPTIFRMVRDPQRHWRYPVTEGWGITSFDVGKVAGDVYGVPLRLLTTLDTLKGNTDHNNRKLEMIEFTSSLNARQYTKAFMYQGDGKYYSQKGTDPAFMRSCSATMASGRTVLSY